MTQILATIEIGDNGVGVLYHSTQWCPFNGRKLQHPFTTRSVDANGLVYSDEFADGVFFDEKTRFFIKLDGSCGEYVAGVPRRRYDRKVGKDGEWKCMQYQNKLDYVECSEEPEKKPGFHWPFMRNVAKDQSIVKTVGDRWYRECANTFENTKFYTENSNTRIAGEWMGPKIISNKSDPLNVHSFIPFNLIEFVIPVEMMTYEGFHSLFLEVENMEGLVAYCANGDIFKIRRSMFTYADSGKPMSWGRRSPRDLKMPTALRDALGDAGNFAQFIVDSM